MRIIIIVMGTRKIKKIIKPLVCAMVVAAMIAPPALCAENIRTTPLKSFFTRFLKPNSDKNLTEQKNSNVKKDKKDKTSKKEKLKKNTAQENNPDIANANMIKGGVVLTIDDCVNLAIKNDPTIKKSVNTQKAQKSAVGIAKSTYFPTITGGTGYNISNTQYSGDSPMLGGGSGSNNYYGLNLGINQLIWDFGYTTAKINMNKYNWEAAGYDLQAAELNTVYNTKIDYTSVLADRANVDIYARSVRINELNVERTRAMYQVGLKSKIDVVNAEATLTNAKINLIEAQNSYQTSLISLNNAMFYVDAPDYSIKDTETFNFQKNYSVRNEIDVAYDRKNLDTGSVDAEIKDGAILTSGIEKRDILKTYSFKPFSMTMSEAIQKAYQNRPDLKSLELVKRASEESLKMVKKSYYPEIDASALYNYKKFSDYGSSNIGIYAGVDLPSINAMSVKNKIEQAKAYLEIADNNVELMRKNIYFQIQTNYVNMKTLEKTIPLMSKKVGQTLENFELADGRYAVGLNNYIELQQAQTDYNNAQLAFVQSVFDYNQARFQLEKAMGLK